MAKNRRKLIEDVQAAVASLPPGATDRDFAPLLTFVLQRHQRAQPTQKKAKPRGPAEQLRDSTIAAGGVLARSPEQKQ